MLGLATGTSSSEMHEQDCAAMRLFFSIRVKVARKPALPLHIGLIAASVPQDVGVR